jgi:hypothetical protein
MIYQRVAQHYARSDLERTILAALARTASARHHRGIALLSRRTYATRGVEEDRRRHAHSRDACAEQLARSDAHRRG